jgi:hypothetical protein
MIPAGWVVVGGRAVELASLSKRESARIDWSRVDISQVDLREWRPVDGGAKQALARELRRRLDEKPPSDEELRDERAYALRAAKWDQLPGYSIGGAVYRGENLTHVPESTEALRDHWIRFERMHPRIAARLRLTAFPEELEGKIRRVHEFEHGGTWMEAIVLKDGRLFFAAC